MRKQDLGRGTAGIGGCLGRVRLATGDVGYSLTVASTNTEVNVTSGKVRYQVSVGKGSPEVSGMTATMRTAGMGYLQVGGLRDSRVEVQGRVERQPGAVTAGVYVGHNTNLTLGPVAAGDLNSFVIEYSTFAGTPSFSVGNLVHPGGDITSPNGSVGIVNNTGLPIGAIGMGNIAGDLRILDNRGFSDTEAAAFAARRSVGGATSISGNRP